MLIGLAGAAGAGKDTVGDIIEAEEGNYKEAFANPIKEMLGTAFGWSIDDWNDRDWKEAVQPRWGFSPRQAAQKLGTEWRDAMGMKTLWCELLAERTGAHLGNAVICDVRFPHEQDWIHDRGGKIINIVRSGIGAVSTHSSETSLDLTKVDYTIENDGTLVDLRRKVQAAMDELQGC